MVKGYLLQALKNAGYDLHPTGVTRDMDSVFAPIYAKCRPFTMTTTTRMFALYKAVEYVVKADIPGDFVETGVWAGGSAMVIAHTLLSMGVRDRNIWLYDTYTGMSEPSEHDRKLRDSIPAMVKWREKRRQQFVDWCYAPLATVRANLASTGYPSEKLVFVKGKVEETLPAQAPDQIALLRLDTDFFESTAHALKMLYPRLSAGGVLLLDDYGSWAGAKLAVDDYFKDTKMPILLNRVDNAGRIGVKPR